MRHPSRRIARINQAQERRVAALHGNDFQAFQEAVAEIAHLESQPDEYMCLCCGAHFPDGPHADLLVAAILIFGEDGIVEQSEDYGIHDTLNGRAGRRFKICGPCVKKWRHHPLDYAEL